MPRRSAAPLGFSHFRISMGSVTARSNSPLRRSQRWHARIVLGLTGPFGAGNAQPIVLHLDLQVLALRARHPG
jgi:hypothetical protein